MIRSYRTEVSEQMQLHSPSISRADIISKQMKERPLFLMPKQILLVLRTLLCRSMILFRRRRKDDCYDGEPFLVGNHCKEF